MTAYRQQALACAASLSSGPRRTSEIRTAIPEAPKILLRNVYGWFFRVERGNYALTQEGTAALSRWPQAQAQSFCPSGPPAAVRRRGRVRTISKARKSQEKKPRQAGLKKEETPMIRRVQGDLICPICQSEIGPRFDIWNKCDFFVTAKLTCLQPTGPR